jgi:hypothetical protein
MWEDFAQLREDGVFGGSLSHFSIVSWENFFRPWKCSRKAKRPLGLWEVAAILKRRVRWFVNSD